VALVVGGLAWFLLSGAKVVVPDVAGQSASTASSNLENVGFKVTTEQVFSETVPNGTVVNTDPVANASVKKGSIVKVNVSKGQERYIIPSDLKGKDPNDVKKILQDLTLSISETVEVYHSKVPIGKVVGTLPIRGSKVKRNTPVILQISKGPAPVIIPPIAGKEIKVVTKQLQKLGLVVDIKDQIFDASAIGSVISSDPTPGSSLKKGETVHLVISKGPPPVPVPNVVGLDVEVAKTTLINAGFEVVVENYVPLVVLNQVYSQDPAGGSMAPPGSTIILKIV
jgi:serine/threonine-protein kinase